MNLRMEQSKPEKPVAQMHWNELLFTGRHVAPLRHGWLAQGSIPDNIEMHVIYTMNGMSMRTIFATLSGERLNTDACETTHAIRTALATVHARVLSTWIAYVRARVQSRH